MEPRIRLRPPDYALTSNADGAAFGRKDETEDQLHVETRIARMGVLRPETVPPEAFFLSNPPKTALKCGFFKKWVAFLGFWAIICGLKLPCRTGLRLWILSVRRRNRRF